MSTEDNSNDLGVLQNEIVDLLMLVVRGNIASFYLDDNEPKPLHMLSPEQQYIIQDLYQGKYPKTYDKLKAIEALAKITGMQKINHTIGLDEDTAASIKFAVEFVNKDRDLDK